MHDQNTPELELGEKIKKTVNNGLTAAAKWCFGAVSAVAANFTVKGKGEKLVVVDDVHSSLSVAAMPSEVEARVEVYGAGSSDQALSFLQTQSYPCADQQGRQMAMIENKGSQPDVINITPLEGVDPCVDTYKLVAQAGYAPVSSNLAISVRGSSTKEANDKSTASMFALQSWNVGSWLLSLFRDPVSLKAYLAHSLSAAIYRNWNTDCGSFTVYIADFSKIECRVKGQTGTFLKGTDGMNIVSGPDALVEQIRYLTFWGVEIEGKNHSLNLLGKGLAAPTHLSGIEGTTLIFDKEEAKKRRTNILVLDLANIKSDSKDEIKKLVKENGNIIKVTPRSPVDTIADFLWSVTKISADEESSTTYQHVSNMFIADPNLAKKLLANYTPPSMNAKVSRAAKIVTDCLSVTFNVPHINASLLTGDRSVNRVLSDILAFLPKLKMRKCIMSNLVPKGSAVAHGLRRKDGQLAEEFVFARNPCLLPNSLKVLKNVEIDLLDGIFDLDGHGELLVIINPQDASDAQADDDGDSVACDPDIAYCELIKEHQRFVQRSIFRVTPKIELAKEARVSYEKFDSMGQISDRAKSDSQYVRLCVLQPEQPLVGLGSDMAVNTIRAIKWVKVDSTSKVPPSLMNIDSYKSIININLQEFGHCWIPTADTCVHLFSWLCLVFVTQTSIDWKKRMYRLFRLELLALSFKLNLNGLYAFQENEIKIGKVGGDGKEVTLSTFAKVTSDIKILVEKEPGERFKILTDDDPCLVNGSFILAKELLDGTGWSIGSFGRLFDASVTSSWEIDGLWSIESLGTVGTTLGRGISLKWKRYAKSGLKLQRDVTKHTIIDEFRKFHTDCSEQSVVKHLIAKTITGTVLKPSILEEYIYEYNSVHFLLKNWAETLRNDSEFAQEYENVKSIINSVGVGMKSGLDISSRRIKGWVNKEKIRFSEIGSFKYFCLLAGEGDLENLVIRHVIKAFDSQLDNNIQEQEQFEEEIMDALDKWIWMGWRASFMIATGQKWLDVALPGGTYQTSFFETPTSEMFKFLREKELDGSTPASRVLKAWGQKTNQATFTGQTLFIRLMNILAKGSLENLKASEKLKIFEEKKQLIEMALRTYSLEAAITPLIQKYQNSSQLDTLLEIVERNIARTLRAIRNLSSLPSKDERFKDFHRDEGPEATCITVFAAGGNLPNAIERIILSKGWAPPLTLLQKSIAKSLLKLEFAKDNFTVSRKIDEKETSIHIKTSVKSKSITGGDTLWNAKEFEMYTRGVRSTYPIDGIMDQQTLNAKSRKQK